MKAVAIVGSPRFGGNTELLAAHTLRAIVEEGIETELIRLAGLNIAPCRACQACKTTGVCATKDDFALVFDKMKAADAIILASPVYYGSATALIKSLMERAGYASRASGGFRGKVGGPLVVARRAGKNFTFAQLTLWFQILGFFIPGSSYWNVAVAREPGEVNHDTEGLNTARDFGKGVAFLLKKINA
jgi:multimeric flavodoxin WrbA